MQNETPRRFAKGDLAPDGGAIFRKRTLVRMWQQEEPFLCESREGTLRGESGDFLAEDGHGGFYPVSAEFHAKNYEEAGHVHWLLAALVVLLLPFAALAQRPAVVAQNLSALDQQAWTFVGHPGWPTLSGAVQMPGGFAVRLSLKGSETRRFATGDTTTPGTGQFSTWVLDEIPRLTPRFLCWTKDGVPNWSPDPTVLGFQVLGPCLRVAWRVRMPPPIDLTLEGWHSLWPDQDVVDLSMQAVWATTATAGMSAELGELTMVVGERPVIDHARRKGLPAQPTWYPDLRGGAWGQTLATARAWGRGSRIQWSGALLCLPAGEPWKDPPTDERHKNLAARTQGPLVAISGGWAGHWGACGELPQSPPGAAPRQVVVTAGDEYDWRPLGEFKEAGTTGEHPDYGCCSGADTAVLLSPAALHDDRWQAQSWGLRPTSNREPDGRPIRAADHPQLTCYNQRPHRDHGQDIIGWTWPVPYSWAGSGYGSVDDQHRSDNRLVSVFLQTRDPAVGSIISDVLELEQRRYWPPQNAPIASPRDWGRTQLAWAHYAACGFDAARPLLARSLNAVDTGAALRRIPQDAAHTVRCLSDNESKYGWFELLPAVQPGQPPPQQVMIRSWNPWQEGLAVLGLWACWLQTGDERARDLAIAISETLVRHAFYQHQGNWLTAYSVRWRTDDPGAPLPASSYWPAEGANLDVFSYPCHNNMLGAVTIAQAHSTSEPVRTRAGEILAAFPVRTWEDALFRAVGP